MKSLLILALNIFWGYTLFAFPTSTESTDFCRMEVLNFEEDLSFEERLKFDLTTGIWATNDLCNESNVSIQFNQKGNANFIFESENTRPDFQTLSWKLERFDGMYFMVWKEETSIKESLYKIEQTCEGILLTDPATDFEICLKKMPNIAQREMDHIKMSLFGKWENATYPFMGTKKKKTKNAFFHYNFNPDGTYSVKFGNDKEEVVENGSWEISRNGKYVIFYQNGNEEKASLAKILHIDLDEMVLEQDLQLYQPDAKFPKRWKTLAFVK